MGWRPGDLRDERSPSRPAIVADAFDNVGASPFAVALDRSLGTSRRIARPRSPAGIAFTITERSLWGGSNSISIDPTGSDLVAGRRSARHAAHHKRPARVRHCR